MGKTKTKRESYTVSDGELVLTLEEAEEGGFVVSSPLYPGLLTQAETVRESFEMARDWLKTAKAFNLDVIKANSAA